MEAGDLVCPCKKHLAEILCLDCRHLWECAECFNKKGKKVCAKCKTPVKKYIRVYSGGQE